MNLGLRAVLYTIRKWKNTLIIFCLLLFVVSLILAGIAIENAQESESEKLRGTTGASFSVERDISTGGWSRGDDGTYSTQEYITEDMIETISKVDGIAGYDASFILMPFFFDETGKELPAEVYSFFTYGTINSQYNELFLSGRFKLVKGSHITSDIENGIIINQELADENGLKIGDTVTGVCYPENNTPEVQMEIVGIFDVVADKEDEIDMYDASSYFDYSDYTFCSMSAMKKMVEGWGTDEIEEAYFYVNDAAQLNNIIKEVENLSSINWNNFNITANDEVYQNVSSSISDTSTLITTLILVITLVSMALIILILSMSIRSRKKETGILLAVGITKIAVLMQYVLETFMISIVAFPLAYWFSKQIAGTLGTLFGKTADSVVVTLQNFILVAIVGGILLIVAVLVSCIPIMRFKPKEILAQME